MALDLLNPQLTDIPTRQFKQINGKRVAFRDVGKGPVVFCIPPWPSSSLAYFQISELLKDKFRFISVDLPGFGGESEWLDGEFSMDALAEFIKNFIESFNIKNYYCIGYSFGGMLAQYCIGKNFINPKKMIYVSTLHTANDVWDIGKSWFKSLDMIENVVPDLNKIKDFVKWVYVTRLLIKHRHDDSGAMKSSLIKELLREDGLADANMIFSMWEKLKDIEVLNLNLKKIKSIVINGNEDPEFLQNECIELANYLGIKPIVVHGNHDHFAFFAEKSKTFIEDFLNPKEISIFNWLKKLFNF